MLSCKDGIKVNGHVGTWYVIDETRYNGCKYYLLESEIYGDEAAALIVNSKCQIVLDDVWNGFDDLLDM